MPVPSAPGWDALQSDPQARVYRAVDIVEADGVTPFALDVSIISGSVSVSYSRAERRTLDLTIDGVYGGGTLNVGPGAIWYDKIVQVYRGIYVEGDLPGALVAPIGTFYLDSIDRPHFPNLIHLVGRDYTKGLLSAKFVEATTFTAAMTVAAAITGILVSGEIASYSLDAGASAVTLGVDFAYEAGTDRWQAITDIASAHAFVPYFAPDGTFYLDPLVDPLTATSIYTFESGASGNLATFTRTSTDSEIYNDVLVTGQSPDRGPVCGRAENNEPTSPTRIKTIASPGGLTRRTLKYDSSLVTTDAQAAALALSMLKVSALESFNVDMGALNVPWLEVGYAVQFIPEDVGTDPTDFLLTDLTIPMELGVMTATAKRISLITSTRSGVIKVGAYRNWGGLFAAVVNTGIVARATGAWGGLTGTTTAT